MPARISQEPEKEFFYEENVLGEQVSIRASGKMFSPARPDRGTVSMLSVISFDPQDNVLDIGCGTGLVGIIALKKGVSKVTFSDIDPESLKYAKLNCGNNLSEEQLENCTFIESDAFEHINVNGFTLILSNPPYHTDFSVAKSFIEGAFRHLVTGGRMVMVTKRLDWYKNKLTSVFGGVRLSERDGYFIFESEKRDNIPANILAARRKAQQKKESRKR